MNAIPQVNFNAQAVVANYPNEFHDAIVMTRELQAWAISSVEFYKDQWDAARGIERVALSASRGERQWQRAGGPRAARNADHFGKLFSLVSMLAKGRIADGWNGWVTKHDWMQIIEAAE